MLLSYFYANCVISHIHSEGNGRCSYSAEIDGRKIEKIHLEPGFHEYLCGLGRNTKNRVWFAGRKNKLIVVAIETGKGERMVHETPLSQIIFNLTYVPIAAGFVASVASFAILWLPFVFFFLSIGEKGTEANPVTFYTAVAIGGLVFSGIIATQLPLLFKIKKLDTWSSHDISRYTKHKFGSGLATSKI